MSISGQALQLARVVRMLATALLVTFYVAAGLVVVSGEAGSHADGWPAPVLTTAQVEPGTSVSGSDLRGHHAGCAGTCHLHDLAEPQGGAEVGVPDVRGRPVSAFRANERASHTVSVPTPPPDGDGQADLA